MRHVPLFLGAMAAICAICTTACPNRANVQCEADPNCDQTTGGICATQTGGRWCAYPDPTCAGRYRFSNQDVGDGLAGACVASQDAGPPDAPVLAGCNNGVLEAGEQCDDGNSTCGACSADCLTVLSAPATGQIVAVDASLLPSSGGIFTIRDGYLVKIFEITQNTSAPGNVKVAVSATDDATMVASSIANAIVSSGLNISATSANSVVVLQNKYSTTLGNKSLTTNIPATSGFKVTGMAGGGGGDCATDQACTQAVDCQSRSCSNGKCL